MEKKLPTGSTGLVLLPFLVEENLWQPQKVWEKFQNIYVWTELNISFENYFLNIAFKNVFRIKMFCSENVTKHFDLFGYFRVLT